jgi:hypothetical protein
MTFLNPFLAAIGLACVGVPILIHILMRRRRRPIQWAAMRFLLEAYQQQRKRLRFEQFLLLAARCLLIALIAIAIGRPVLGRVLGGGAAGPTTLYLVIDNGLASSAQESAGAPSALARHKERAIALLAQLNAGAGDRVALVSAATPARAIVLPPTSDLSGVRELIEGLRASDGATDLASAISLVRADGASEGSQASPNSAVAVLSDFRVGSLDLASDTGTSTPPPSGTEHPGLRVLASEPAASALSNTTVSAIEPLRPLIVAARKGDGSALAQSPVRVSLRRSGDVSQSATTSVRLLLSPASAARWTPIGTATFRWSPGQSQGIAMGVIDPTPLGADASGSLVLSAQIDADAIAGDNTDRRTIELRQSLRVGIIAPRGGGHAAATIDQLEPADWFRLALQTPDAEIETIDIEPGAVDAARLAALDAAILPRPDALSEDAWRRVRAFADSGGLVVLSPPPGATVNTWPDAMNKAFALGWSIPRESRAFSGAIAPSRSIEGSNDLLALLDAELRDLLRAVRVSRVLSPETSSLAGASVMLSLSDGSPLLFSARPGQAGPGTSDAAGAAPPARNAEAPIASGLVVMLGVAPSFEWTDLQAKPLMVPLVQEMVRQGVGRARGQWMEVAGRSPRLPAGAATLRALDGEAPQLRVDGAGRLDPIERAGAYRVLDDRGATRGIVAINADPMAGRVETQPRAGIEAWLTSHASGANVAWLAPSSALSRTPVNDVRAGLGKGQDSARLVLGVLLGALALGVVETLLARWFSHARTRPGDAIGEPAP